jgi:hypothetical protein
MDTATLRAGWGGLIEGDCMINSAELTKAIRTRQRLYLRFGKQWGIPAKIGKWNGVECVLFERPDGAHRVFDKAYTLKNFHTTCQYF